MLFIIHIESDYGKAAGHRPSAVLDLALCCVACPRRWAKINFCHLGGKFESILCNIFYIERSGTSACDDDASWQKGVPTNRLEMCFNQLEIVVQPRSHYLFQFLSGIGHSSPRV